MIERVPIITRSEWGAREPGRLSSLGTVSRITVHHTAQGYGPAAKPDVSEKEAIRYVRKVEASHRRQTWADVGYHFLIDGAGRIYQGRSYKVGGSFGPGRTPPKLALGSHVGGKNSHNIGVCVLGCFGGDRHCDDVPSDAALGSLEKLIGALMAAYDVRGVHRIVGHRDLAATVCPGDRLYAKLPHIRARLDA